MRKIIYLLSTTFCCTLCVEAQTMTESDYIRNGNKLYADSLFEKAEIEYRKALDLNPTSADAMYNLGNALFGQAVSSQEKGDEAYKQYSTAAKYEADKGKLAQIYHNLGTLLYSSQQYPQSVEAYKESLRNNPYDHETRYNLAKAMHMNKQQQQEQQEQQQENQEEQKQEQQQNQEEQQQEQQQQEQQQEQQNQEQQQEQEQQEQISKENAEQILNALMQDEKDVQEKQKKMMQHQGKTFDKDW
ncbi:MAG: tetratricopeptide repeat protein [Bacteroidaceae bacterium]|nr:tetratricopeptide repeat protein [Bacteroidaceae bacterium]